MAEPTITQAAAGQLAIAGELDFANAALLWQRSQPFLEKNSQLNFDLAKVTRCNSGGLALLLEWIKYAKRKKKQISFHNIPQQLLSIATVSGLEELLAEHHSEKSSQTN